MRYSKQRASSVRTLHYIKLFESFDNDNEDYIVSSIRDILIELEDDGMGVDINYSKVARVVNGIKIPAITIEITGKWHDSHNHDPECEGFEVSSVRDYIDTTLDFIEGIWPSYDLYFEKYDIDDPSLTFSTVVKDGKVLKDGLCGSIVIQIYKKK